jgi:hypothetical protein
MVVAWAIYGANADATVMAAQATMAKMPEAGREWVMAAAQRLDASTLAWLVGRLARVDQVNLPKE